MSITTVGNHLIHYEALGRGEPMVFLHGWLGSWRYWWPTMQELSSRFRTFAFDLWGFGDSSKAREKYLFEAYVEMLDQFVENLGIYGQLSLVGHALGAAVALRYCNWRPDNVSRLVLVALPFRGDYIDGRLASVEPASLLAKLAGRSNDYPEVESETHKTDGMALREVVGQIANYSFSAELKRCACPVLLIYGGQDPLVRQPAGELQQFRTSANNRHVVLLDDCYHFPMLEQTSTFNRLILDFVHADTHAAAIAPKEQWQRRMR